MNKNFKFYLSIWSILFVIFNVAVFVTPSETAGMTKFGGAFRSGYIFITLAFLGQLAVSYFALKTRSMQKLFYNIPLITISWTGLVLTLIFGTIFMIIPNLPNWIGIIVCFAILGFNAISLIKANTASDIVSEIDDKVKAKTEYIKMLTADAEHLMNTAKTAELKAQAKKVYEAIRYSDPMSNAALVETETQIEKTFSDFATAVNSENTEDISAIGEELVSLIDLRNKKCKLLK